MRRSASTEWILSRSALIRYSASVVFVGSASLVHDLFRAQLQESILFLYLTAVFLSVLVGGWKPGVLALAFCVLKVSYFHSAEPFSIAAATRLGLFAGLSLPDSYH